MKPERTIKFILCQKMRKSLHHALPTTVPHYPCLLLVQPVYRCRKWWSGANVVKLIMENYTKRSCAARRIGKMICPDWAKLLVLGNCRFGAFNGNMQGRAFLCMVGRF